MKTTKTALWFIVTLVSMFSIGCAQAQAETDSMSAAADEASVNSPKITIAQCYDARSASLLSFPLVFSPSKSAKRQEISEHTLAQTDEFLREFSIMMLAKGYSIAVTDKCQVVPKSGDIVVTLQFVASSRPLMGDFVQINSLLDMDSFKPIKIDHVWFQGLGAITPEQGGWNAAEKLDGVLREVGKSVVR
ncbi:MAG TPA: hypothetical protein VF803_02030 [Candidatus Paceibacterota bacterium]